MKTQEAAKGRWNEILSHYNLEFTGKRHIRCPICDRKGSSGMRINEHRGECSYICVCGSGSGFQLLLEITGLSFRDLANDIDKIIGNTREFEQQPVKQVALPVKTTLGNLQDIRGTSTEIYLKKRQIKNMPDMSISHCSSTPLYDSDGNFLGEHEAMVAKVTDSLSFEPLQLHITYLKNGNKITRKVRNLTETEYKSPVVRLFSAKKTLGIAEGIETALSAHELYDVPTWATINSGFMKKFRAPKGITKLIIYADNDKSATGQAAAFECARANLSANNDVVDVTINILVDRGDFNDACELTKNRIHTFKFSK